jgi:metallo-beta-lactamase class B
MGHPTEADPQYHADDPYPYPAVPNAQSVEDGQVVTLGDLVITAHRTPGHTPGGSSWSWQSGKLHMVYADSLTPMTTNHHRFTEEAASFHASIAKVRDLPCDILVTTHPSASSFWERVKSGKLADPKACRIYADAAERTLDRVIAKEGPWRQ